MSAGALACGSGLQGRGRLVERLRGGGGGLRREDSAFADQRASGGVTRGLAGGGVVSLFRGPWNVVKKRGTVWVRVLTTFQKLLEGKQVEWG